MLTANNESRLRMLAASGNEIARDTMGEIDRLRARNSRLLGACLSVLAWYYLNCEGESVEFEDRTECFQAMILAVADAEKQGG